jgi:hypothetical protein
MNRSQNTLPQPTLTDVSHKHVLGKEHMTVRVGEAKGLSIRVATVSSIRDVGKLARCIKFVQFEFAFPHEDSGPFLVASLAVLVA